MEAGISPVLLNGGKAKYLFIGSITINEGIEKGFYYTSSHNKFWNLLDGYFQNTNFAELKKRPKNLIRKEFEQALKQANIAICDIFGKCYFKKENGKISTQDKDIIHEENGYDTNKFPYITYEDCIKNFLQQNPTVKIFINGELAWRIFNNWLKVWRMDKDFEPVFIISPSQGARLQEVIKQYCWNAIMEGNLKVK